jgi:hypothetical protein
MLSPREIRKRSPATFPDAGSEAAFAPVEVKGRKEKDLCRDWQRSR